MNTGGKRSLWRVLVTLAVAGMLLLLWRWSTEAGSSLARPPELATTSDLEVVLAGVRSDPATREQAIRSVPFVAGVVVDKLTARPVSGARVVLGDAECQSNVFGHFRLEQSSSAESRDLGELKIAADGYAPILVQERHGSDLHIELQRNRGLSVRVVEQLTGVPLTYYRASLLRHDSDDMYVARRSSRRMIEAPVNDCHFGWVWFRNADPGQYFVLVELKGRVHITPIPKLVNWTSGHCDVLIEVGIAGELTVQLLEADGSVAVVPHQVRLAVPTLPSEQARNYGDRRDVSVVQYAWQYPLNDKPILHYVATSDSFGRVVLPCPRKGPVALAVALGDAQICTVPYAARNVDADEVVITLPSHVALSGVIRPSALLHAIHPEWPEWWRDSGEIDGASLENDEAVLPKIIAYASDREVEGGDVWQAVVSANGDFHLDHIPIGKWRLCLSYYSLGAKRKSSLRTAEFGDYEWWVARKERLVLDGSNLVPVPVRVLCRAEQGALSGMNILLSEPATSRPVAAVAADLSGVVVMSLAPGRYVVSGFDKQLGKRRRGLLVTSGNATNYEIDLGASNLAVRMSGLNGGVVLPGIQMRVHAPDIAWYSSVATTNEHGVLLVESVPNQPGALLLEVESVGKWVPHRLPTVRKDAARSIRVVSMVLGR